MPSPSRPLSKVVPCKGIKAANKEVSKVAKSMKSAREYTRGGNGSASTIHSAVRVSRNQTTSVLAQSVVACSISARTKKGLAQLRRSVNCARLFLVRTLILAKTPCAKKWSGYARLGCMQPLKYRKDLMCSLMRDLQLKRKLR